MPISIGANIASLRAQRQLGQTTDRLSRIYERLASGQRINHASDDAAGLSISSQLKTGAQLFTQALRNVNDGVSAIAVAEGAGRELSVILQRQKELATQAANGTYGNAQRTALQRESNQLTAEFNRIIATTSFNGMALLDGRNPTLQLQAGTSGAAASRIAIDLSALANATAGSAGASGLSASAESGAQESDSFEFANSGGYFDTTIVRFGDWSTLGGTLLLWTKDDLGATKDYYLWFDTTGFASDPGQPAGSDGSATSIKVSVIPGTSAADVAGLVAQAVQGSALSSFVQAASSSRGQVSLVNQYSAGPIAVPSGTAATYETDTTLGFYPGTSFLFSTPSHDYYAWFNSGTTSDPGIAGRIGIRVDYDPFGDVTALLNTAAAAIGAAVPEAVVSALGTTLTVTSNARGAVTAPSAAPIEDNFAIAVSPFDAFQNVVGAGSDVNPAADTFNLAAHGFTTGQALTVSTSDSLPAGLSAGTYYAIVVNANTIKLATSASNALAGTAVNLTGYGSGTTTFTSQSVAATPTTLSAYISDIDISTQSAARSALGTVDSEMQQVATFMGALGSSRSRLESALGTLAVSRENYLAAAARITDVDMASQSAELTRQQILQQAATAVLSQANQSPALALQLLR